MRVLRNYLVNHRYLVRPQIHTDLSERNQVVVKMLPSVPSRYFLEPVFPK